MNSDNLQPVAYNISRKARCLTVSQDSLNISSSSIDNDLGSRYSSFGAFNLVVGSRLIYSSEANQLKKLLKQIISF